jgi:aerobic-type carbon monoxide dehydrogenase small subunit (CoxS/CutS family)
LEVAVVQVGFTLNGRAVSVEGDPLDRLLDVLRDRLGLTGTKEGCGEGECGACTVLMDGEPVLACLIPLVQCRDREIVTIEGLAGEVDAPEFLEGFVREGGTQCGACTPGILVAAWPLARNRRRLRRGEIRRALTGNLCRCTGYEAILRALEKRDET